MKTLLGFVISGVGGGMIGDILWTHYNAPWYVMLPIFFLWGGLVTVYGLTETDE